MNTENNPPHIVIDRKEGSSWAGWCVHYAGFFAQGVTPKTHCDAGVEYASVTKKVEFTYSYGKNGHRYKSQEAHPCFKREAHLTDGCAKCRFPTAEEISAHDEATTGDIKRMVTARNAILDELKRRALAGDATVKAADRSDLHRWHTPQTNYYSGGGKMPCPVCKTGTLGYSRAGYNGHVHASCSTQGCVSWME